MKIDDSQLREVFELAASGETHKAIAAKFQARREHITHLLNGRARPKRTLPLRAEFAGRLKRWRKHDDDAIREMFQRRKEGQKYTRISAEMGCDAPSAMKLHPELYAEYGLKPPKPHRKWSDDELRDIWTRHHRQGEKVASIAKSHGAPWREVYNILRSRTYRKRTRLFSI